MLKSTKDKDKVAEMIGEKFVTGYPHHGYCIDCDEGLKLGLNIIEPKKDEWKIIWELYKLYVEDRRRIQKERNKKIENELIDRLKDKLGGAL